MLRIALTGGIATGKSYVAFRLREAGVPVVDADVLAREAIAPGTPGLAAVVRRFGVEVLTPDGRVNRPRLGEVVFRDDGARRDLELIVHPVVRQRIDEFFRGLPAGTPLAVADVPLLYETGLEKAFDQVIVSTCTPETQIARVMARNGLTREEAERRVAAQLPIEAKALRADHVIRTDGAYEQTDRQVADVLTALRRAIPDDASGGGRGGT